MAFDFSVARLLYNASQYFNIKKKQYRLFIMLFMIFKLRSTTEQMPALVLLPIKLHALRQCFYHLRCKVTRFIHLELLDGGFEVRLEDRVAEVGLPLQLAARVLGVVELGEDFLILDQV
jgi:hypothetical protein